MGLRAYHFLENYLPTRQAYIFDTLNALNTLGVENEIWTYKTSNLSIFPNSSIHSFQDQNFLRKNMIRLRAKIKGSSTYLSEFCGLSGTVPKKAILHGHFIRMTEAACEVKSKRSTPVIITAYGDDLLFEAIRSPVKAVSLRKTLEGPDLILTPSRFLFNMLQELMGDNTKIRIWHMGIDVSKYRKTMHSEKEAYRILSVGRLVARKGYKFLIEAMPPIVKEIRNVKVTIVGEGPEKESLEQLASDLGVSDSLEIVSPQVSLIEYFASSDVFVLPSILIPNGSTEGLGVPLLEASASNLPVVASNVGGIPEGVEDGKTGYLVSPSQPQEIADAVLKLLYDFQLRERLGAGGFTKVMSEFDLGLQARKLCEYYSNLTRIN